jgi:hypothetical protein
MSTAEKKRRSLHEIVQSMRQTLSKKVELPCKTEQKSSKKRRSKRFRIQQKLEEVKEELARTRAELEKARNDIHEMEQEAEWDAFIEKYRRPDGLIDCFRQRR